MLKLFVNIYHNYLANLSNSKFYINPVHMVFVVVKRSCIKVETFDLILALLREDDLRLTHMIEQRSLCGLKG